MKFLVVIAEDEPPVSRYVSAIVGEIEGLEVAGVCEDGAEALELVRSCRPHILISDIHMPEKSGLELIKEAKELCPGLRSVILSGYKVFEYAQEAIRLDTSEYLLKPIDRDKVRQALQRLRDGLLREAKESSTVALAAELAKDSPDPQALAAAFPHPLFQAVLLQRGCVAEFAQAWEGAEEFCRRRLGVLPAGMHISEYRGALLLLVGCSTSRDALNMRRVAHTLAGSGQKGFYTAIVQDPPLPFEELHGAVRGLFRQLRLSVVVGRSQVLDAGAGGEGKAIPDRELWDALMLCLRTKRTGEFREVFSSLFELWEKEGASQAHVQDRLYTLVRAVCGDEVAPEQEAALRERIDEALVYAGSLGELMSGVWGALGDSVLNLARQPSGRAKELYDAILRQVRENLDVNYTLQEICDMFGVSQPYVSRLFRRYCGKSFKEYAMEVKIGIAARTLLENPETVIKDLAQQLGFENALYFGKVFKNHRGVTPSQYKGDRKTD